ncbi:MAG TPA: DUF2283 domain-containing protein [Longimicrobium sp.]|jgi:uncharacterized protein YuzE
MSEPRIWYDEPSDALHIAFIRGRGATGIELNENILLRIDTRAGEPVGITIFNFSIIAQPTDIRPRRFPLTGLADLDKDMRDTVMRIIRHSAVADYLTLSADPPAEGPELTIPILSLQTERMIQHA